MGNVERHSSRVSFAREADAKPALQKPTIRVKDFVKVTFWKSLLNSFCDKKESCAQYIHAKVCQAAQITDQGVH